MTIALSASPSHRPAPPARKPVTHDPMNPHAAGTERALTAAMKGDVSGLKRLVGQGVDLNRGRLSDGRTPAHMACGHGQRATVAYLSSIGVGLQEANREGCTPTWWAAKHGHVEVLRFLASIDAIDLDRGPITDDMLSKGMTPTYIATQCGYVETVGFLADEGAVSLPPQPKQPAARPAR